jgi:hypothetical protein
MNETAGNSYRLDDQQRRMLATFFPHAFKRTIAALDSGQRFVYYTSAETAMHILRSSEVWMRKSSLMNDYREIEHGFDCLNNAYKKNVKDCRPSLTAYSPVSAKSWKRYLMAGFRILGRTPTSLASQSMTNPKINMAGSQCGVPMEVWRVLL